MNANYSDGARLRFPVAIVLAVVLGVAACALTCFSSQAYADDGDQLAPMTLQGETHKTVTVDDFEYTIYYDDGVASSIWISKYVGTATEVTIPTSFTYEGKTYPSSGGEMIVGIEAFMGNTKITKVAIPNGVEMVGNRAFKDCVNLTEAAIGDEVTYIADDAFEGCPNLKTYLISGKSLVSDLDNSGIGVDEKGDAYSGVTVYTVEGSKVDTYVKNINDKGGNQITTKHVADPYSLSTVKESAKPATSYSPGATEQAVTTALAKYAKETDPKGTVFNLLRLKVTKVTSASVKLAWSKVPNAKKYVIYGNKCGTKNKMLKQTTSKKLSITMKKVNKKKLKKGTYYKFTVVALDKNGKVLSTSKMVHAATTGGKVGNDKNVTTAAKKNKAAVKAKRTFKLKGKPVAASKKLTVKRHRGIAYESTNPKIATVTSKGVIKGVSKGKCYVYAYAQNGVFKKITVTVK